MRSEERQNEIDELDPRIMKIAAKIRELRIEKGYSKHEHFAWDNDINRVQY